MNPASNNPSRPWWQPGPLDWSQLEMLFMRAGFALLIFSAIRWETGAWTTQKFPNGIAASFNLTWIGKSPPGLGWQALTVAGLAAYAAGRLPVLGLIPALFFSIVIGTLGNSQGAINHSTQMVTMILLAQWLVYLIPFQPKAQRPASHWVKPDFTVQRQAIWWSTLVIAASYVVCGLVKLVNSNGLWLYETPYLAVQLLKTNWSHYHDTLEMPPGWLQSLIQALTAHPNLARLFFGMGLLIELGGFVILISRRWALAGGLAIIALHLSISQVMSLNFLTHIYAVLIFCVNVPSWMLPQRRPQVRPLLSITG
jgi:hypothetical protein